MLGGHCPACLTKHAPTAPCGGLCDCDDCRLSGVAHPFMTHLQSGLAEQHIDVLQWRVERLSEWQTRGEDRVLLFLRVRLAGKERSVVVPGTIALKDMVIQVADIAYNED